MKYLVIVCALWQLAQCRVLPEYLKKYSCRQSDPQYEKCLLNGFENTRPFFIRGIPELKVPPMDPFELPLLSVNRTISEVVSINAVCKNIKVIGGANAVIESVKADPFKQTGDITLNVPWMYMDMEYDVKGHLLVIPLQSSGFFKGNFTNIQMNIKGGAKKYKKDGVEYFKVNKISTKITVGDGRIKLTEKDPQLQYGADLIANFFNENPRRVMDAVNPIFLETSNDLFRIIADQISATLPASEWLPA